MVVLGHCRADRIVDMVINSFHMVAFFRYLKLHLMPIDLSMSFCIATLVFCIWSHQALGVVSIICILPFAVPSLILRKTLAGMSEQIRKNSGVVFVSNLILFAVTVGLNYLFFSHSVYLSSLTLGCVPLYLMSSVSDTVLIYTIAMALPAQRILQFFGKNSMYYYGLHYEVIGVIEKILPGGILQTMGTFAVLIPVVACYKTMRFRRG